MEFPLHSRLVSLSEALYFFISRRFFEIVCLFNHFWKIKLTTVCTQSLKLSKTITSKNLKKNEFAPTAGNNPYKRYACSRRVLNGCQSLKTAPALSQWEIRHILTRNILSVENCHSIFAKNALLALNAQMAISIFVN